MYLDHKLCVKAMNGNELNVRKKKKRNIDFSLATARIGMRQAPGRSWCEAPPKVRCLCICEVDGHSSDRAGPEDGELRLMPEKQRGRRKVPVSEQTPHRLGQVARSIPPRAPSHHGQQLKFPLSPARNAARGGWGGEDYGKRALIGQ